MVDSGLEEISQYPLLLILFCGGGGVVVAGNSSDGGEVSQYGLEETAVFGTGILVVSTLVLGSAAAAAVVVGNSQVTDAALLSSTGDRVGVTVSEAEGTATEKSKMIISVALVGSFIGLVGTCT